MKFLVDENIQDSMVTWLRSQGHDVLLASDRRAVAEDDLWLAVGVAEERLILTSDKDFGELIYSRELGSYGVVLLRIFDISSRLRLERLKEVWSIIEANPSGKMIVVTSHRVRVRPLRS